MPEIPELDSERLRLRGWTSGDADALRRIYGDPVTMATSATAPPCHPIEPGHPVRRSDAQRRVDRIRRLRDR